MVTGLSRSLISPLLRKWQKMLDNRFLNDDNRAILGFKLSIERSAIFTLLNQFIILLAIKGLTLCGDNVEYFSKATSWSGYNERMVNVSTDIQYCSKTLRKIVSQLQEIAPRYDYDDDTPGNGFST
ncbi:hypothetical protein DICVIV_10546 [Dictyocaulus viviparus]|uniref:Hormone-sensitive lipase N-terminal domain-containing protein n=1 Tax=Dictyocaulus viviparus TaxID=29172 RepID=A0A0D8XM35_DICVI|nr:hypothetical protein DICVIV_10546 [Dictyocaulus viviparus]